MAIDDAGKNNFLPASVYFLNIRGHGNYERDLFHSQLRNFHFQFHLPWCCVRPDDGARRCHTTVHTTVSGLAFCLFGYARPIRA
ncbi:hypothetical protein Thimo_2306 [Thioflavicoccus mobilis 8321]|uniref:Uncharacterized protein n=1 Tax=Thioflavicoccus mobilis 8321 TaxID=765912 RepID=L0H0E1_9GAMM|nr:hypothetical protein Thimo_2306 [Thioflavicoccus mobilis 8321]